MTSMKPKSLHPLRMALRVQAAKLERDLLGADEKRGLAALLRGLADGHSADEVLGVIRTANRPVGSEVEQRVAMIETLRMPPAHGGAGMTAAKAIEEVAEIFGKSISTVESDYSSARAKRVREQFKYP